MRILLVTLTDMLPYALSQVLNPSLEYCAIVVDEPAIAKQIFKNYPQVTNLVHPFYELKECIENFYFEVALCISGGSMSHEILPKEMRKYGLPVNKLINLHNLNSSRNFNVAIAMQYYKNHYKEFDIFATGISYTALGLVPALFSPHHKLFNFSRDSQDLYYDYQTAKFVLNQNVLGGGAQVLLDRSCSLYFPF